MAITVVQSNSGLVGGGGPTIAATFSGSVTVGNRLIAVAFAGSGSTVTASAVTDNKSNAWTKRSEIVSTNAPISIFDCVPTTGGTSFTVTITYTGSSALFGYIAIWEVSGLVAYDTQNTASGTGTAVAVSTGTLASASEFVVGAYNGIGSLAGDTAENSGTYTNKVNDANDSQETGSIDYKTVSSSAAVSLSYTITSQPWSAAIATWTEFAPVSRRRVIIC